MDTSDNTNTETPEISETPGAEEIVMENGQEAPVTEKKEKIVYVGPNMGGSLPMTRFRVYSGGLPKLVQARVDADANFAKMFVSVDQLDKARDQIRNKKSVLGKAYLALKKGGK